MLLSKAPTHRLGRAFQSSFGALIVASFVILLSGCGFQPLYGSHGTNQTGVERYLAKTLITQIKDRLGQQLHNDLLSRLNPLGVPNQPHYRLDISISESIANLGVSKSSVVTRGNLRISATYTLMNLFEAASGKGISGGYQPTVLSSGTVFSTSSYDIPQAQYAVKAALKDARKRAVREIADDLKTRLAVYFKQNPEKL